MQTAEQVVAALTGGVVSTAVNIPAICAEDMEVLGPFLPLCRPARAARRWRSPRAPASSASRSSTSGRIAERDTRLLTIAVLNGVLAGHTEEEVNLVNAPSLAEERGIEVSEREEMRRRATSPISCASASSAAASACGSSAPRSGRRHRPHLLEAWGQRFNLQLDDDAPRLVPLLRPARA